MLWFADLRATLPRTAGVAAVVTLWTTACGNPVGNPDPFFIPPTITDFNGNYGISHTFSVPGTARTAGCTGNADLRTDNVFAFGGTIDIDAAGFCAALPDREGELVGSIRGDEITFSVEGFQDPLAVIGCSSIGGGRSFEGSFRTRQFGDVMRVQSFRGTLDALGICDGEIGETQVRWEIRASRR